MMADDGPRLRLIDGISGALKGDIDDLVAKAVRRHVDAILKDYVLAPKEPTSGMIYRGGLANDFSSQAECEQIYKAMLEAISEG